MGLFGSTESTKIYPLPIQLNSRLPPANAPVRATQPRETISLHWAIDFVLGGRCGAQVIAPIV